MPAMKTFRSSVRFAVPPSLSERGPSLSNGWKVLWSIASMIDLFLEACNQGLYARMPTRGTETALPYIGRDRMLRRGPSESDFTYGERLRNWLSYWRTAGNALSTMLAIRYYLPVPRLVRIYLRSGFCWTLGLDGEITWVRNTDWDWDSNSNPERTTGHQTDIWIVVYPDTWPWSTNWGDPDGDVWGEPVPGQNGVGAFGFDVQADTFSVLRDIIVQVKGAHCYVRSIIFPGDTSFADPLVGASQPDGWWGTWGRDVGGDWVASRDANARYWEPRP